MSSRAPLLPVVLLLCCATSLGSAHIFSRVAFAHGVNVLTVATARSAFAALLLFALLTLRSTPIFPLPARRWPVLTLGILITAQTLLLHTAVWLLPVTVAILAFYTFPFFTGLGAIVLGQEKFSG